MNEAERIIKEAMDNPMRVTRADITPDIAQQMVFFNTKNRKIKPQRVKMYSRMLKDGNWKQSTTGIGFTRDVDGNIIVVDGGHRLNAIIESGITAKFTLVVWGADQTVCDKNSVRTYNDTIKFAENDGMLDSENVRLYRDQRLVAAVKFLYKCIDKSSYYGGNIVSAEEVVTFIDKYKEYITPLTPFFAKYVKGVTTAPVIAALLTAHIKDEIRIDKLLRFATVLHDIVPTTPTDMPALALRSWLINHMLSRGNLRDAYIRTCLAIRAVEKGSTAKTCRTQDTFPWEFNSESD